ncbi:dolichol kinase [Coprinopsis marcescibilis]|uniref:dolichol kinase n=1 Tax=Coprinopsis marcescibilis TaxID=230819 RepID=A0A5C3L339_COPMA|nr:dolichol kinase [Coprinopsis marcescibilis]
MARRRCVPPLGPGPRPKLTKSLDIELRAVSVIAALYYVWAHSSISLRQNTSAKTKEHSPNSSNPSYRPGSPRHLDKDPRKTTVPTMTSSKSDFGYIWMSVPKNYRESSDDGIATGLLLGPLISAAVLISAIYTFNDSTNPNLAWLTDPNLLPTESTSVSSALQALVVSRLNLVNLGTFCSMILLAHVCGSWWLEGLYGKTPGNPEGERVSVPRSEGRRLIYFVIFTGIVSLFMVGLKALFQFSGIGIWQDLRMSDAVLAAPFYSLTLYAGLRLAHRGFTVGELSVVCYGGTSVCLEFLNFTRSKILPGTYTRTYRLPTPLLIFQIAMVVGSLLTGFILSPFLVLSRNNAQQPSYRVRSPTQHLKSRRYYALGFYAGSVLLIAGPIGLWARWQLGNRDPWLWAVLYVLEGKNKWSRPLLLGYWALLGSISVAGWGRQLSRSRKHRMRNQPNATAEQSNSPQVQAYDVTTNHSNSSTSEHTGSSAQRIPTPPPSAAMGRSFPTLANIPRPSLPNLPNGSNVSNVASDLLYAADKRVPILGLNARRKFFHGLAVVMFIPGIVFDPAFTHLSFSAAFALFTFTEYVRYFAIYPFGASIHLFLNEFLDHRDSGTAILSHFYLLTGCAGSVWLEDPSKLLQVTGVLTLGVGDAAASIVGRRIGLRKWSPTTNKTIEGSLAFVGSVFGCAWLLRLCGLVEPFSSVRYLVVAIMAALLEALSDQNDNLTLPLYMWSMLVVLGR